MATNKSLMTVTMIAASFGVALATAGASLLNGERSTSQPPGTAPAVYQELTAQIRTDWLAPSSARRSLEQRNQALERWVIARHGWVQVVDTEGRLRTRGALGERLQTPTARFEQTLLIHVPAEHAPATIARALEGLDVTVASIDAVQDQPPARIEF